MAKRLGKYLLLDRINHGGMADVYLAKTFGFGGADQIIALKRIRQDVCEDPAFVEMFVDEAKLSVQLTHANIARTFELGHTEGSYYIAMEHVAGRDLRAVLDRVRHRGVELPEHIILQVIAQVLEGLDYAHRKTDLGGRPLEIVHRDVSPQNVLISYTGEVKLIDFGIAKAASQASQSQAGVLKGKYGYMSPEQVMGLPVDPRSDVFAAGVLLYELFTRERLFDGTSDFSILEKVRHAEVYPPSVIAPRVSADVDEVVLRALSHRPEDRYPTASDMLDAVVELILRRHGTPTARELSNLMHDLFEEEIAADMKLLEKARQTVRMPGGIESIGTPGPGSTVRASAGDRTPGPRPAPTLVDRPAYAPADDVPAGPREVAASASQARRRPAPAGDTREPARPPATQGPTPGAEDEEDDAPDTAPEAVLPPELALDSQADAAEREEPEASDTQPNIVLHRVMQMDDARPDTDRIPVSAQAASTEPPTPTGDRRPRFAPGTDEMELVARPEPTARHFVGSDTGPVKVTKILTAYRPKISRDLLIVVAAFFVAVFLVLFSWLATRGDSGAEAGRIMVLSVPSGAQVVVDGVVVGQTPYQSPPLPAGRHTLVLERDGYASVSRVIEVRSGEETPVQLVLQPTRPRQ